jgi:hypothetical protein
MDIFNTQIVKCTFAFLQKLSWEIILNFCKCLYLKKQKPKPMKPFKTMQGFQDTLVLPQNPAVYLMLPGLAKGALLW